MTSSDVLRAGAESFVDEELPRAGFESIVATIGVATLSLKGKLESICCALSPAWPVVSATASAGNLVCTRDPRHCRTATLATVLYRVTIGMNNVLDLWRDGSAGAGPGLLWTAFVELPSNMATDVFTFCDDCCIKTLPGLTFDAAMVATLSAGLEAAASCFFCAPSACHMGGPRVNKPSQRY